MVEMKMVLASVVRDLSIRLEHPGPVPVVRRSITFAPKGGVRIVVQR
jgi:cytochrome P450